MRISQLQNIERTRISDNQTCSILDGCIQGQPILILLWSQLGDFDSLEYAWWIMREWEKITLNQIQIRAIGIGDRRSGQKFCQFTGFPEEQLFIDPTGDLHQHLQLYPGLQLSIPGLSPQQNAWINLFLMCAGIGSPGTLAEVLRGYVGDRKAPQLIDPNTEIKAPPLPTLKGKFFNRAGGEGFQRPFELATLRLRNMVEVLGHWRTYVPDNRHMTQRGGTFLFDADHNLIYDYRDSGILGFSESMHSPLSFLWKNLESNH